MEKKRPPSSVRRRGRRRWLLPVLLALVTMAAAAGLPAVTPAVAQEWNCPETEDGHAVGYVLQGYQDVERGPLTRMLRVDPATGQTTATVTLGASVDGIGFNTVDNYFYGVRTEDRHVVRIESSGALTDTGVILPFDVGPVGTLAADFNGSGRLLVANRDGHWVVVDFNPGSPTRGTVVAQGEISPPAGLSMPGDWTYLAGGPAGNGFYGVSRTESGEAHLVFFDLVARTLTDLGERTSMEPAAGVDAPYRATFTDGTGDLYVTETRAETEGTSLWRLTDVDGPQTAVSTTMPAGIQDGAQCRAGGAGAAATITLAKDIVDGRAHPDDQFSVWLRPTGGDDTVLGSITTTGTETHVRGEPIPVNVGQWYWVVDGRYLGSWWVPEQYIPTIECVDSVGNRFEYTYSPSNSLLLNVPYADDFTCTATNRNVGDVDVRVDKTAEPREVSHAGQVITYHYTLFNNGRTTINEARLRDWDPFTGTENWTFDCPLPPEGLPPGTGVDCGTREHVVTEQDLTRHYIDNWVDAEVRDEYDRYGHGWDSEYVDVRVPYPNISLTKSASPSTVSKAGEQVTYTYEVNNTGESELRDISLTDHVYNGAGTLSPVECPATTLAPGAAMLCKSTYTVAQQDIDQGDHLFNDAWATGVNVRGDRADAWDGTAVDVAPQVSLEMTKSAEPTRVTAAEENVTYTFTVVNTGTATLENLRIADPRVTGRGRLGPVSCQTTVLAPGERTTCIAHYTVSQADMDTGGFDNTATATADGAGRQAEDESSAHVDAERTAGLSLVKSAGLEGDRFAAGQRVTYRYLVTNTGNTTLTGVAAADTAFSGHGDRPDVTCPDTELAPGDSVTCTATYTLVQADIDERLVTNKATATANAPDNVHVTSNESDAAVTGTPSSALTLTKGAAPATVTEAGQTVTYTFGVRNAGDTTLTGLRIVEDHFDGSGGPLETTCVAATLAPGASTTCTATYRVTQQDLDRGRIANTATAVASAGTTPVVSAPADATVTAEAGARLTLEKTATPTTVSHAGQTIEYTYLITNAGHVTVRDPGVADDRFQAPGPDCTEREIPPGRTVSCTGTYTVTAQDVEAGRIVNSATAFAAHADDGATVASNEANAEVAVARSGLKLTKTSAPEKVDRAGEEVFYTFTVTNTGQTVLNSLAIEESRFTGSGGPLAIDCPDGQLAPGGTAVCTAHYTVTQADIAAGGIENTAAATALPPGGGQVTSPEASARVTTGGTPPKSSLSLDKKAKVKDTDKDGRTDPGDLITWTFTVTNTGSTELTGVAVTDPKAGRVTCAATTLAPGSSTTCAAQPYRITKDDARAGRVTNTATAAATDPDGRKVTSPPAHSEVIVEGGRPGHRPKPPHGPDKPKPPHGPGKPRPPHGHRPDKPKPSHGHGHGYGHGPGEHRPPHWPDEPRPPHDPGK